MDLRTLKAYAKMMEDQDLLVLIVDGDKVQMQRDPNAHLRAPKTIQVDGEQPKGGVSPKMLKKPNETMEILRATGKLPGSVAAAREEMARMYPHGV